MRFFSWSKSTIRAAIARAVATPNRRRHMRLVSASTAAEVFRLESRQLLSAAPVIVNNTGLTVHTGQTLVLTSAILLATDVDSSAAQLTYTLTGSPSHGQLQKLVAGSWNPLATDGTFTQRDVNSGTVRYVHNGSVSTRDTFGFTLSDGVVRPALTTRISVNSDGIQGNGIASSPSISGDGRFVAFESTSSNLVAGDTNGASDVFVYDLQTGQVARVSVSSSGAQGNHGSGSPRISSNGRFIAYTSSASNLVAGDTNNNGDVFVYDRATGQTTRISVDSSGNQANDSSFAPFISADGRFVSYSSIASNLTGGDTNGVSDVFVFDRLTSQATRVSVSSTGVQGNSFSYDSSVSADGRFVTFTSGSTNLIAGATYGAENVYLYDLQTRTITCVSTTPNGLPGNSNSHEAEVSADGRFVVYSSDASNLLGENTRGWGNIYLYDRVLSQTRILSRNVSFPAIYGAASAPTFSADGRYVTFSAIFPSLVAGPTNESKQVYRYDRQTNEISRVSKSVTGAPPEGDCESSAVSADGRMVVYSSTARNLVPGDTNPGSDIFVDDGQGSPVVAGDVVVTIKNAPPVIKNNTGISVRVGQTLVLTPDTLLATDADDPASRLTYSLNSLPANGELQRVIGGVWTKLVPGGTFTQQNLNNGQVRYVHSGGTLTRDVLDLRLTDGLPGPNRIAQVSVTPNQQGSFQNASSPHISADGRFVAYASSATDSVPGDTNGVSDVFVFDRQTNQTTRVSASGGGVEGNAASYAPSISADGRFVSYSSDASNLVDGDTNGKTDVFVYDRQTGQTTRVSLDSSGLQANDQSYASVISASGRFVAYASLATNLVTGDTNGVADVFVYDRQTNQTTRVSIDRSGAEGNGKSDSPSISADGRFVAYASEASNLVTQNPFYGGGVFLYDRQTNRVSKISVSSTGVPADDLSIEPSISADGQFVAFSSKASNLIDGSLDGQRFYPDVYVYDVQKRLTTRVSQGPQGERLNYGAGHAQISGNSRYVTYESASLKIQSGSSDRSLDVFVFDRWTGETTRVSVDGAGYASNGSSLTPAISYDGRFVTFGSNATNLNVPSSTYSNTNIFDIFAVDREAAWALPVPVLLTIANSIPVIAINTAISVKPGQTTVLSQANLLATDADNTPSQLTYTLGSLPVNGLLQKLVAGNWITLVVGSTFTQQSINNGLIRYVHSGGPSTNDVFSFTLTDGVATQASTSELSVNGFAARFNADGASVSADGRFVTYASNAGNLVPGDVNGLQDIFLYDRKSGQTTLVSAGIAGVNSNGYSVSPKISADGSFITFSSNASNLVNSDTNNSSDIFLYDIIARHISRVSVNSAGNEGDRDSTLASISSNGRFIVYWSASTNLQPDVSSTSSGIFVYDRQTGQTSRVATSASDDSLSYSTAGVSDDGRFVTYRATVEEYGPQGYSTLTGIFLSDRQSGTTIRISVPTDGLSGRWWSTNPEISADGQFVAYESTFDDFVAGKSIQRSDVFLYDRLAHQTIRVSASENGAAANGNSLSPRISSDGRFVVYDSFATNLVVGDTNNAYDVFLYDRQSGRNQRISPNVVNGPASFPLVLPSVSADGRFVVGRFPLDTDPSTGSSFAWHDMIYDRGAPPVQISGQLVVTVKLPHASVLDGATIIPDNTGAVTWGTVIRETPVPVRSLTITNTGVVPLVLLPASVTPNSGFTIVQNFTPGQSVAVGGTATLRVALNSSIAGAKNGTLSFVTNDPDANPYNFTLSANVIAPPVVTILDDGDVGFSVIGNWSTVTSGFGNDRRLAIAGAGTAIANWAFTNLLAGEYRIFATWNVPASNRANDALFTVRSAPGAAGLLSTTVNQRVNPAGFTENGTLWQSLGNVTISGNTLLVSLANTLSGLVTADAIRIERVSTANSQPQRAIVVDDGDTGFALTGNWSSATSGFGNDRRLTGTGAGAGTATATWTFGSLAPGRYRVSATWNIPASNRADNAPYTIGETAGGPPLVTTVVNQRFNPSSFQEGGTLWQNLGDVTVFGNTLVVRLSNTTAGLVTADAIRIERIGDPVAIIDDGDAGFATTGGSVSLTSGYGNDRNFANAGNGTAIATWTFTGLAAGTYRIATTWIAGSNRAHDLQYVARETSGGAIIGSLAANQRLAPAGSVLAGGVTFQTLGDVTIVGNQLVIRLANTLSGSMVADAIRIERVA